MMSSLRLLCLRVARAACASAFALSTIVPGSSGAQALGPVKIGIIWSYTGLGPAPAQDMDTAIATWVRDHGDTVAGRKVVFIKRDDTGLAPDVARRQAQDLIVNEHVDFLAGLVFTPNVMAVAPIAVQAKVPLFLINASGQDIVEPFPYVARFSFTAAEGPNQLGRWAASHGIHHAYALYQDVAGGIEAGLSFEKSFVAGGGHLDGETRIPRSAQEFSAYVQRAKDAKPDAVFIYLSATSNVGQFMKAVDEAGLRSAGTKLLSAGDFVAEPALPVIGTAGLGIVSAYHYSVAHDSAVNRQFVTSYHTVAPTYSPSMASVAAYDAFHAIYNLIALQKGNLNPDRSMQLVRGMKFESPRGPILIDPATRDIVQNIYIRRVARRGDELINQEFETIPMVRSEASP